MAMSTAAGAAPANADDIGVRGPGDRAAAFEWTGRWSGPVENDARPYDVHVTLKRTQEGELHGPVRYPQLHCSGRWYPRVEDGDEARFAERITDDPRGACMTRVKIFAELVGPDSMDVNFVIPEDGPLATVWRAG